MRDADRKLDELKNDDLKLSAPKCRMCATLRRQLEKALNELIAARNELQTTRRAHYTMDGAVVSDAPESVDARRTHLIEGTKQGCDLWKRRANVLELRWQEVRALKFGRVTVDVAKINQIERQYPFPKEAQERERVARMVEDFYESEE